MSGVIISTILSLLLFFLYFLHFFFFGFVGGGGLFLCYGLYFFLREWWEGWDCYFLVDTSHKTENDTSQCRIQIYNAR